MNKRNHLIIDGKSTAVLIAKLDDKSEIVVKKGALKNILNLILQDYSVKKNTIFAHQKYPKLY